MKEPHNENQTVLKEATDIAKEKRGADLDSPRTLTMQRVQKMRNRLFTNS
jgi:hypothetical protein